MSKAERKRANAAARKATRLADKTHKTLKEVAKLLLAEEVSTNKVWRSMDKLVGELRQFDDTLYLLKD